MTMKPWLARALRRSLATLSMVLAVQSALYRVHHVLPELPPAGVDLVEVTTMDGSHTITDRAAVDRILAIVRTHRGEWSRFPGTICLLGTPGAEFYQGTERRGSMVWSPRAIIFQDGHGEAMRLLSPRDGAELQRLLAP